MKDYLGNSVYIVPNVVAEIVCWLRSAYSSSEQAYPEDIASEIEERWG